MPKISLSIVISFLSVVLFFVLSCSEKENQTTDRKQTVTQEQQEKVSPPPSSLSSTTHEQTEPPPQSEPEKSYDYTDIKDIDMDGSGAIGKTAKMQIMMDYSGIDEGTFRAYGCKNGDAYTGTNFRMSFSSDTRQDVRNLESMECTSGYAIFKITGKGRLEDFTAKLIKLSVY